MTTFKDLVIDLKLRYHQNPQLSHYIVKITDLYILMFKNVIHNQSCSGEKNHPVHVVFSLIIIISILLHTDLNDVFLHTHGIWRTQDTEQFVVRDEEKPETKHAWMLMLTYRVTSSQVLSTWSCWLYFSHLKNEVRTLENRTFF